ncbi:MAG: IS30 family transposase [Desulfobulbaceae bacterium]|nr:IS30 family transposase [Desulfobulbaceae bacterium]MCK5340396.1 IS30 family transposase [Desulfobulbaceae bacterium]
MSYTHLTEKDRYVISHLSIAGFSLREIGRRLDRHHTTISRELQRAKSRYPYTIYWYDWAQPLALERTCKPRHFRRQKNTRLVRYVEARLRKQWSPEEISHRLHIDYPNNDNMRVSHETIYRWAYLEATIEGDLYLNLRRRHKKRRRQKRYGKGYRFADRKCITQRPEIVDGRQRYGDWEGDTIEGKKSSGYIATMVERKSRYLLASKLENKMAATLTTQGTRLFRPIPRKMRKTLTVDNGSEFAQFKKYEERTGLDIYFAKPYSPWQRGANENTNGLLRQYFPKGFDFKKVTEKDVYKAVERLNNRPRKCLNYRTPKEIFWKEARGALAI